MDNTADTQIIQKIFLCQKDLRPGRVFFVMKPGGEVHRMLFRCVDLGSSAAFRALVFVWGLGVPAAASAGFLDLPPGRHDLHFAAGNRASADCRVGRSFAGHLSGLGAADRDGCLVRARDIGIIRADISNPLARYGPPFLSAGTVCILASVQGAADCAAIRPGGPRAVVAGLAGDGEPTKAATALFGAVDLPSPASTFIASVGTDRAPALHRASPSGEPPRLAQGSGSGGTEEPDDTGDASGVSSTPPEGGTAPTTSAPPPQAPGTGAGEFSGSFEPAGPDLSIDEEKELISRGWK